MAISWQFQYCKTSAVYESTDVNTVTFTLHFIFCNLKIFSLFVANNINVNHTRTVTLCKLRLQTIAADCVAERPARVVISAGVHTSPVPTDSQLTQRRAVHHLLDHRPYAATVTRTRRRHSCVIAAAHYRDVVDVDVICRRRASSTSTATPVTSTPLHGHTSCVERVDVRFSDYRSLKSPLERQSTTLLQKCPFLRRKRIAHSTNFFERNDHIIRQQIEHHQQQHRYKPLPLSLSFCLSLYICVYTNRLHLLKSVVDIWAHASTYIQSVVSRPSVCPSVCPSLGWIMMNTHH